MTDKQHSGTLLQDDQLLPEFRRLVILVPNADMDDIRLARAIRSMMSPSKKGILLLTQVTQEGQDSLERRRLTNLEAVLRDPFYTVTSKILFGNRLLKEIKKNLLPGDLVVCLKGYKPQFHNPKRQPIGQTLADQLPCPVYVLNHILVNEVPRQAIGHQILGWVVPIVIILLFMGFDARIILDTRGWVSSLLLGMVLLVEVGLIYGWTNLWN